MAIVKVRKGMQRICSACFKQNIDKTDCGCGFMSITHELVQPYMAKKEKYLLCEECALKVEELINNIFKK
jgi:hypothetical protein